MDVFPNSMSISSYHAFVLVSWFIDYILRRFIHPSLWTFAYDIIKHIEQIQDISACYKKNQVRDKCNHRNVS